MPATGGQDIQEGLTFSALISLISQPSLAVKFRVVATGGTFDEIHVGHIALLSKAFQLADKVIIGVSSDNFAEKRGKRLNNNYERRVRNLEKAIVAEFGEVNYEIAKLEGDFGPAVTTGNVGALVASRETQLKAATLNDMRVRRGLKPVEIFSVEMVKAEDGSPVSSTRIRAGEIDRTGKLVRKKNDKSDSK